MVPIWYLNNQVNEKGSLSQIQWTIHLLWMPKVVHIDAILLPSPVGLKKRNTLWDKLTSCQSLKLNMFFSSSIFLNFPVFKLNCQTKYDSGIFLSAYIDYTYYFQIILYKLNISANTPGLIEWTENVGKPYSTDFPLKYFIEFRNSLDVFRFNKKFTIFSENPQTIRNFSFDKQ